jgi:hypothetical protein
MASPEPDSPSPSEPELTNDLDLQNHLRALGLSSLDAYRAWCSERGFSPRIDKPWKVRCRERYQAAAASIADRGKAVRRQLRRPQHTIEELVAGRLAANELVEPFTTIAAMLRSVSDQGTRDALAALLSHVAQTRLLSRAAAVAAWGRAAGNTWLEGLAALARFHSRWKRPLLAWRPASHSRWRQFASLCRHLLADYPTPAFLDAAWFLGGPAGERQQGWFVHVASGGSVRTADLPVRLTRKMAHQFLLAPSHYTPDEAIRWAQVRALGGGRQHLAAILSTHLADCFEDDPFWVRAMEWLIHVPDFERHYARPVFDYLRQRRQAGTADAATDASCLRGRSLTSMWERTRAWYRELAAQRNLTPAAWSRSGVQELHQVQWVNGEEVRWSITELVTSEELQAEGRFMGHCVASYQRRCEAGTSSIWSLRRQAPGGKAKPRCTIELAPGRRRLCQVRGRANRQPWESEMHWVRLWAEQEGLTIANNPTL